MKKAIDLTIILASLALATLNFISCNQTTVTEGERQPRAAGIIAGPTEVNEGQSIELTIRTIEGALTYKWTKDDLEVQNSELKILVVSEGGTYRVTGVNAVGEGTRSPGHVVVFIPTPPKPAAAGTITGPTEIAEGGSITLEIGKIDGAATYQWYKDGVKGQNGASQTLTVTEAGTYKVAGVNAGGEGEASPDHVVVLAEVPPTPPTPPAP
jgi:hypothetical protein